MTPGTPSVPESMEDDDATAYSRFQTPKFQDFDYGTTRPLNVSNAGASVVMMLGDAFVSPLDGGKDYYLPTGPNMSGADTEDESPMGELTEPDA